jgi:predicted DNA-binding mobile mystery protein A
MRLRPLIDVAEEFDEQIQGLDFDVLETQSGRWVCFMRSVWGLPATTLAKRMGISQPAVTQLEKSEAAGSITLAQMRRAAEALQCEFVYGLIPTDSLSGRARALQAEQDQARRKKRRIPAPR